MNKELSTFLSKVSDFRLFVIYMDFNLDNYDLHKLLALFEIKNLNEEELKKAKRKVILLHPDKNTTDTTAYFEFFMRAYKKIETVYS